VDKTPVNPRPHHEETGQASPRRLVCPQCKAAYRTASTRPGRRVRCRHCGHVWRDDAQAIQTVAGALDTAAAQWFQLGSAALRQADHASTIGHLVTETTKPTQPLAGDWVGRTLGRYKLKAVLGQGAMGYVYEAEDLDLHRTVALKLLPRRAEEVQESLGLKMFLQEARIAARLQHPNIVTIHEIGYADGLYFFAMELVRGVTLFRLIEQHGPLPASGACYVIAHAATALAEGHRQGVIHRDVKPGNIMIDAAGHVKVTDFGLAYQPEAEGIAELAGKALGTPGWISPEVARGRPATAASDIYGLGLTLYFVLTRQRLIRAETRSGMIRLQREARSLRREQLPGSWPPRLRDIVVQCLQAEPGDRYQSAEMLAADLLRALVPDESDATVVLGSGPLPRPSWAAAFFIWFALGIVFALALLYGVVWWTSRS